MLKKTIYRGAINDENHFEKEIEFSTPANTRKILVRLGKNKIYLSLDTAEELAKTLLHDITLIRDKINTSNK